MTVNILKVDVITSVALQQDWKSEYENFTKYCRPYNLSSWSTSYEHFHIHCQSEQTRH